jgi:hypothetical protein
MRMDLAARILSYCSEGDLSVSGLAGKMGGSHDRTMALVKELKAGSLLLPEVSRKHGVGRPSQILRATPIGKRFVREYNHLRNLPLRSNENDIKKALHQAELARRLVEAGISPYGRLEEVNQLARNIASTAKANHRTR